jgi:hypothetical protein
MRWVRNMARTGDRSDADKVLVGENKGERDHVEELNVDGQHDIENDVKQIV